MKENGEVNETIKAGKSYVIKEGHYQGGIINTEKVSNEPKQKIDIF